MGQAQSEPSIGIAEEKVIKPQESSRATSMESLISEAAAFGESVDESESVDSKAEKALECPCISELRNGECGTQFSDAFLCFLKSTSEEKGSDCVHPFVALQKCIKVNPGAFSRKDDVAAVETQVVEEVKKEEVVQVGVQRYRMSAPLWAREPSTPKPKL